MKRWLIAGLVCTAVVFTGWGPGHAQGNGGAAEGKQLFDAVGCSRCHYTDSQEQRVGPGFKGLFDREKMPVSGRPVSGESVREQILNPYDEMPSFADQLDAQQIDAIIAYLKTL